jgi:hypothetical protein
MEMSMTSTPVAGGFPSKIAAAIVRCRGSGAAVALAVVAGACDADSVGQPMRTIQSSRPAATAASATVPDTLVSQLFKPPVLVTFGNLPPDTLFANDFTVPAGQTWHVTSIVLQSFINPAVDPTLTVDLAFRANGSNQPSSIIRTYSLRPAAADPIPQIPNAMRAYRFDLPSAEPFGPGTYWIQVQCDEAVLCMKVPLLGLPSMRSRDGGTTWAAPIFSNDDDTPDIGFGLIGTVETAADDIHAIETSLSSLGLDHGTFTSLEAKLDAALADLAAGDTAATCGALQDFINLTSAQTGKKLTAEQAATLITEATRIRSLLGC